MPRPHYLLLGVAGYALAVLPMIYFVGFIAGVGVRKHVDSGVPAPLPAALVIDLALLLSFAAVHSALARPAFKAWLAYLLPAELERSLYSAVAGVQIVALMAFWRPLPVAVWRLDPPAVRVTLWLLFAAGWAVVVWALRAIDETRLFGLRQAVAAAVGRPDTAPPFVPRGPYRWIRHPLYSGTILALFAAPDMSQGRLLLATVLTAYIVVGARFEERDLERRFGDAFRTYRGDVPAYLPDLRRQLGG